MSKLKSPSKTRLRRGAKNVRRSDKLAKATEATPELSKEMLNAIKLEQEKIDTYNNKEIYERDSFFDNIQLHGDFIVVRMFKENYIKFIDESNPDDIQVDAWHRQIDGRLKTSDPPKWVSTPFPYLEQGVIVSISPSLVLEYYKQKEELEKHDPKLAESFKIPKEGDVVRIKARNSGWFKENRYYIDKQEQCLDFVRDQTELRLSKFDHYFLLKEYDLESITNISL